VKMHKALFDYLDGTDITLVAAGARVLDKQAFASGQISKEALQKTLNASDIELFNQRNEYRAKEAR